MKLQHTLGGLEGLGPVTFEKRVTFAGSQFDTACFKDVEFLAATTFASLFRGAVDFRWALFAEDSSFVGTEFKQPQGVQFTGFRVEKQLRLTWGQLEDHLATAGTSREEELVYLTFLDNFKRTGDLDSENACLYAWRERFHPNWFANAIWGYGVRPFYTFLSIVVVFGGILVSNFYLLDRRRTRGYSTRERWWNAAVVAFETSWVNLPPLQYATGERWKLLLIGEWLLMKILQAVFIIACSNTSRLLKELVPRLLPG